jgi:signal transduction histidine kinase
VLAMYNEVTEQRRHDDELRQAQAAAAELEGIHKTTVTYAHEVNNPLTAILANTQILLDNEELGAMEYSAEILEMLQDINAAALRIRDVIHQLENLHAAKTRPYLDRSELIDLRDDEPPA